MITTGDASIVMKKDGTITIDGKDISLTGSGQITAKASKDMVLKGQKILQNRPRIPRQEGVFVNASATRRRVLTRRRPAPAGVSRDDVLAAGPGVVVGIVTGIDQSGRPLVAFGGGTDRRPSPAAPCPWAGTTLAARPR